MSKRRLKLTLEYDGTNFYGWQVQTRTGERTVQGVLQAAFAYLPGDHSAVHAAGRTDAGVHALAMAAHIDTTTHIPNEKLLRALNAHLPDDLAVLTCEAVPDHFEAQFSCLYRYYIYKLRYCRDDLRGTVLDRHYVLSVFSRLDITAMQDAAPLFEGTHDFAALATQETRPTVKTVYLSKLSVKERNLTLHIVGNGFLRNMVRAVVGTLLLVGQGKVSPEAVLDILASKDRSRAGENAPPHGLYFAEAGYRAWTPNDRQRILASKAL